MKPNEYIKKIITVIKTYDKYQEALEKILTYIDNNNTTKNCVLRQYNKDHNTNHDNIWEWTDVAVEPRILKKLYIEGITQLLYSSNKYKLYTLREPKTARKILQRIQEETEIENIKPTQTQTTIPKDIFSTIVGYEDIQKMMNKSLQAERHHVLFVGTPATGKTVFLMEIGQLKNSEYMLGHSTTAPGLTNQLFAKKPRYVLIDEIDKMGKEAYSSLLSLMETGIVKDTKGNGNARELTLTSNVYGACNTLDRIPPELISRFEVIRLKPYTKPDFIIVCNRVLKKMEHTPEELALYIPNAIISNKLDADVRMAIRIARLSKTTDDVDDYIKLIKRYR